MTSGRELRWENTLEPGFGPPMRPSQPVLARPANLFNWGLSAVVNSCSTPTRVLNYLTFSRHGHRTTHGIPWHPHGISCHSMAPWGVPWHVMGGTMAVPAATATALHGRHSMATSRHVMTTPTAPQCPRHLGLGLGFHGMPWKSVECFVVGRGRCRGTFCRTWYHGMPRLVARKDNNEHASFWRIKYTHVYRELSSRTMRVYLPERLPP